MGDQCSRRNDPRLETGDALALDDILDLLSREVRRDAVSFCRSCEGQRAEFDALVEHVVEKRRQRNEPVAIHRIRATLHHVHLPRLAEHGVLEYDSRSGDIRYWGGERLEACLDRIEDL